MSGDLLSIRTLICLKDPSHAESIAGILGNYNDFDVMEPCSSGQEAIERMQGERPKLIFISTELPDMTGFELIHKLYPLTLPKFIFIAEDDKYATKAFDYFAFDYIVAPFTNERIHLSLLKVKESFYQRTDGQIQEKLNALFRYVSGSQPAKDEHQVKNGSTILPVKMGGRIYFIREDEVQYIVASGYYIEIYANGKKHLLRQSLRGIVEKLDASKFLRIHRSVVISIKYLKEITKQGASDFSAKMEDGASFRISKSYKGEVFEHIGIRS